jgi:anti-sigma regulatory factor (Ser/Thr protein kinase)
LPAIVATTQREMIVSGGRLVLRLPETPDAVGMARDAVAVVGFSVAPEVREDAQLVVSELVANGLEHGRGGVTISLSVSGMGRLSGEVFDDGDGFDEPQARVASDPRGWGFPIVAALAGKWGIHKGSTRVWFAMPSEAHRFPEAG